MEEFVYDFGVVFGVFYIEFFFGVFGGLGI